MKKNLCKLILLTSGIVYNDSGRGITNVTWYQ